MRKDRFLQLAVFVLTALTASWLPAEEANQPNIVLIFADDLGWKDLGCYGSRYYETPQIDRLAERGMKFTSAYTTASNCQPTRAALLSGQYSPRTGVYTVGGTRRWDTSRRALVPVENVTRLPRSKVTFADVLKSAGYATGMFGKWHLGNGGPFHPRRRGFDRAIVAGSVSDGHFGFKTTPRVDVPDGAYLADFLTDQAVEFIKDNRRRPFFLYLSHFAVHSPFEAKEELIDRFKNKPAAGDQKSPVYAAMIASLDESVGRILQTLEETGQAENTLVIFYSDNGGVGGYSRAGLPSREITDNRPLRGGKGMFYEGGIRVPFIAVWPGRARPGSTCDVPITTVDLFPTFVELAGAERPEQPTDGESLVPLLDGDGTGKLERDAIYWHFPGYLGSGRDHARRDTWRTTPVGAIRSGKYKLLEFFEDGRLELYDLDSDRGEQRNLVSDQPELSERLHEKLQTWRKNIKAPMPKPRGQ